MHHPPSPPLPAQPPASAEVVYPDWDPDALPELPPHLLALATLVTLLRYHFRDRDDVYVIGNVFWYYEEGNPSARKAPDVMVIKGVDPRTQRHSFKSWEHNTRPCFILEILSERTAEEDTVEKVRLYERLGVREYFLFDPEGAYLGRPLVGYRLMLGKYEELPPGARGQIPSAELGLFLCPEGDQLALVSMKTGERLAGLPEMGRRVAEVREELEETRRRAEEEHQRAEAAERRAEQERRRAEEAEAAARRERERAEQAEQRAAAAAALAEQERRQREEERRRAEALAAELARLRAALSPPEGTPPQE